jgi:hypothetical protein
VQVVCVDEREDFDELHGQYMAGDLLLFELYALSEEEHVSTF